MYYWKHQKNGKTSDRGTVPLRPVGVSVDQWKHFLESAKKIRSASGLTDYDRLLIYALYKQASVGNAPEKFEALTWNIVVDQAKYDAWDKFRGMPQEGATRAYIEAVEELLKLEGSSSNGSGSPFAAPVVSQPIIEEEKDENEGIALTELLEAASNNDIDKLKKILSSSNAISIDTADSTGQTALHLAADKGFIPIVRQLIEHGANVSATDQDGISVLQTAVAAGNVEVCRLLLKQGADPDQADVDGDTPRSSAMEDGSAAMKELFV